MSDLPPPMTDRVHLPTQDDLFDMHAPVGSASQGETAMRLRCLELALMQADVSWTDALWISRRFARFVLVGDTPHLIPLPDNAVTAAGKAAL